MNRLPYLSFLLSLGVFVSPSRAELVTFRTDPVQSSFAYSFGVNGPHSNAEQLCTGCTADLQTTVSPLTLQYDTLTQQVRFLSSSAQFADSGDAVGFLGGFPFPTTFPGPSSADVAGVSLTPNSFWYYAVRNAGASLAGDWFDLGNDTLPTSFSGGTLEHNYLSLILVPGGAGGGGIAPLSTTPTLGSVTSDHDQLGTDFSELRIDMSLPNIAVNATLLGNPSGTGVVEVGNISGTGIGTLSLVAHSCTVEGDYNCSGETNNEDLIVWQDEYDGEGAQFTADGDGDDNVDGQDFLHWQRNFGNTFAPFPTLAVAVPEPSTFLLLAFNVTAATLARHGGPGSKRYGPA